MTRPATVTPPNSSTVSNSITVSNSTRSLTRFLFTRFLLTPLLFILLALTGSTTVEASSQVVKLEHHNDDYVYTQGGNAKAFGAYGDRTTDFQMITLSDGRVAFRALNGAYLTAVGGGGGGVRADAWSLGDHEKFNLISTDPTGYLRERFFIRTDRGLNLCAKTNGKLEAGFCDTAQGHTQEFGIVETEDLVDDLVASSSEIRVPTPLGDIVFPHNDTVVVNWSHDTRFGGIQTVESISGYIGLPSFPLGSVCGPLCALGTPEIDSPGIQIAYGTPDLFQQTFDLPLDPGTKYFYLMLSTSAGLEWGPFSVSAGDDMVLILDHRTPTLFFYTTELGPVGEKLGIEEAGFGVSGRDSIRFVPTTLNGSGSFMNTFEGELYMTGTWSPSLIKDAGGEEFEHLAFSIRGDGYLDVNTRRLANGNPDFVNQLGINADFSASLEVGAFGMDLAVGGGSLYYDGRTSTKKVAFSGEIDSSDGFLGLPLPFKAGAAIYGYVDTAPFAGDEAFVVVEGEAKFTFAGGLISTPRMEGRAEISESGASFTGSAAFGTTDVDIDGVITSSRARFEGSLQHTFGISSVIKAETEIEVVFDTNLSNVDLDASARWCVKPVVGNWNCTSVSTRDIDISMTGSGKLKVCVKGNCDTLG